MMEPGCVSGPKARWLDDVYNCFIFFCFKWVFLVFVMFCQDLPLVFQGWFILTDSLCFLRFVNVFLVVPNDFLIPLGFEKAFFSLVWLL